MDRLVEEPHITGCQAVCRHRPHEPEVEVVGLPEVVGRAEVRGPVGKLQR